jgi:hypothetical protein
MSKPIPDEGKILYRFKPKPAVTEEQERRRTHEDWADEYVIVACPEVASGIIIYGYYESRKEWFANPHNRPLVAHLLDFARYFAACNSTSLTEIKKSEFHYADKDEQ